MGINFKDYGFRYHKKGANEVSYEVSRKDEDADPKYYGFSAEDSSWMIMEANEANGTFKYFVGNGIAIANGGEGTLTEGWTGRASHSYVDYPQLFV